MKNFKTQFKIAANNKNLTATDMVAYHALVAFNSKSGFKSDIMKSRLQAAFTPKSGYIYSTLRRSVDRLKWILSGQYNVFKTIFGLPRHEIFESEEQMSSFKDFLDSMTFDFDRHYVYVFVRQDIFPEYQLVQAAHATMVAGQKLDPKFNASQLYFTVCGVENYSDLLQKYKHIQSMGYQANMFYEPDIKGYTAFASEPIHWKNRGELKNYPLLKFSSLQ